MDAVELLWAHLRDRAIGPDRHRLVQVVAHPLDLAKPERQDGDFRARAVQHLDRLRQLGLFKAIGGKNRHTETIELGHEDSPGWMASRFGDRAHASKCQAITVPGKTGNDSMRSAVGMGRSVS